MAEVDFKGIRFVPDNDRDFGKTLRKRVNAYFKENNIAKTGDYRIWIKVIVFPLLAIIPFLLVITNNYNDSLAYFYALWVLMGIGIAGCGLGIMHDACHGSLSKNKMINHLVGLSLNLAGGYTLNWKIQHNVLHHTYTNVDGYDEDIAPPKALMRFSPHQPHKPIYKYQIFYAWILYGLMTFSWAIFKDFIRLKRYKDRGLLKAQNLNYKEEFAKMVLLKIIYFSIIMVLPIVVVELSWLHIFAGWMLHHFVAGVILGIVFQPAHCIPEAEYPLPDENNQIKGDWYVKQLLTTANFAPSNRILSWYVGGLNFQIEHHLFPQVCHVHHRALSKIVKKTTEEFNLPYYSTPTFIGALKKHAAMLIKMGRVEA
jgi:linoleoyl-CoA desaturase